ncbi:MAG: tyrosine-type recombinase/integrase [Lawsonibacter sp.]
MLAHIAVLNMIFNFAIYSGYIEVNPAASIKPPSGLKTTRHELPEDNCVKIVEQSVDMDFELFAYLLLYTGMRRGEAMALKWEDIDFDAKVIHVSKSIYYDNNKPVVKAPKSEAGTGDIILLDRLAEHLPKKKHGYIFERNGQPFTLSAFQKRWRKYCLEAGLAEDVVTEKLNPETKRKHKIHSYEYHVTPPPTPPRLCDDTF